MGSNTSKKNKRGISSPSVEQKEIININYTDNLIDKNKIINWINDQIILLKRRPFSVFNEAQLVQLKKILEFTNECH